MEFKTFFSIMKNRISDGADVPYFFRDLIAMITTVSEKEWGTKKDPNTKLTNNNTLRTYSKRGLPKTFSQNIVYRLDDEMFIESLTESHLAALPLLAEDFKSYDASANSTNIARKLADVFVEIIRTSAGIVEPSALERQRQSQNELDLRNQYGDYLLNETGYACPFPGCGHSLITSSATGRAINSFNVVLIDKAEGPQIENLLAVCPSCYATYSIDDNPRKSSELKNIKKILAEHQKSIQLLDSLSLEEGIVGVLSQIKKLKMKDIEESSLDPKELTQKIDPNENLILYNTIKSLVSIYYPSIHDIMINADKRGDIDYDEVQDQIHAMYKKLNKAKKTKEEIFNEIVEKIHKVSLYEEIYCQIVVSFFVQKCEVFDAIAQ